MAQRQVLLPLPAQAAGRRIVVFNNNGADHPLRLFSMKKKERGHVVEERQQKKGSKVRREYF